MKPLIKFHSIVLSITAIIFFTLWKRLMGIEGLDSLLTIALLIITPIGLYRLLLYIAKYIVLKVRCFKKIIFGAYYLEGVWVGFFLGKEGKVRFYVETYEQHFDSITIRGKGFRENEGYFGTWVSDSVAFDVQKGTITYTYQSDAISNSFVNPGLAIFNVERIKNNAAPHKLIGFSADLYNPIKMKSFEMKINDKPDVGSLEEAIEEARKLYEKHQYIFKFEV